MTTQERIRPIIERTYGTNAKSEGLVKDLAEKIDNYEPTDPNEARGGRENMILLTCWNWFSGGTIAENTARRIEQQLPNQEPS